MKYHAYVKRLVGTVFLSLLIVSFFTCSNPLSNPPETESGNTDDEYGRIVLSISISESILGSINVVTVTGTGPDGATCSENLVIDGDTATGIIDGLINGNWTFIVQAKEDTLVLYEGQDSCTIESGSMAQLTITLLPVNMVATPTFSPGAGNYSAPQLITISCATVGATIYYTLDASVPGTSSNLYSSPIEVNISLTIMAIAVKDGMENSNIASASYIIDEQAAGKFKLANSWGVGGSWENVPDGFLWITYEAMKSNSIFACFYEDIPDYNPQYIVTFQLTHQIRGDCEITIGLGEPSSPVKSKRFDDYYFRGGNHPFPDNIMVMDITEFGADINTYDLFLEIYDSSGNSATGTIDSFTIEKYDNYNDPPSKVLPCTASFPVSTSNGNSAIVTIQTAGNMGEYYPKIAELSKKAKIKDLFNTRLISETDLIKLKKIIGIYDPNKNYNIIIDGHGTGLVPPTEEEWQEIKKNALIIDSIKSLKTIGTLLKNIDNSADKYFPPIGNQGYKGSCVSFSTVYYIKTFQEALDHNWDLSTTNWIGGSLGEPDKNLNKIFSPDFVYHQVNDGEDGGSTFSDNIAVATSIGVSSWEKFPYNGDGNDWYNWPNEEGWREAPKYRGQIPPYENWGTFYTLTVDTNEDIEILETLLSYNILVSVAIDAGKYSALSDDDLWDVDNYNNDSPNHANTIVGYNN